MIFCLQAPLEALQRDTQSELTAAQSERAALQKEVERWRERCNALIERCNQVDPEEMKRLM